MILFPKITTPAKYHNIHPLYIKKIFEYCGEQIQLCDDTTIANCKFVVVIDGIKVVFDYSDHLDTITTNHPYFKFHTIEGMKTIPFSPVSFYDWSEFYKLREIVKYNPLNSNLILSMQRPYAAATERRQLVQRILQENFGDLVVTNRVPQTDYWQMINKALVHVFAPGARNDMLDRGQLQYLGFGCCAISPPIPEIFPYSRKLQNKINYIECQPDYSDLPKIIDWCVSNRDQCLRIGQNAKELFDTCFAPMQLLNWIKKNIKENKNV